MAPRKRILKATLVGLYLATWVGGWLQFALDSQERAQERRDRQIEYLELWKSQHPGREEPIFLAVHPTGPHVRVNWAVPVLPGVLVADLQSSDGPLIDHSGTCLVLYYGVGTVELGCFSWWLV